ncbi:RNA polymerase sigma factor region1.1 domain-containing protein [Sabulicella rubraurantiaca]|uniref:RNA polymerase sigma factor region1.1 domain-containing protein n=1 Tax=Sabulicella rubraurantiaca TaxID=2811429 RepID=UPI001A96EE11|nr:RNA polymerase sigma factor region1.1 domain-containing protein [Sabulicella rubraurantiaca]
MTTDAWEPALDRLIEIGRERGYVTVAELSAAIPSEKVSAVMVMLSEMGVGIVTKDPTADGGSVVESPRGPLSPLPLHSGAEAPLDGNP